MNKIHMDSFGLLELVRETGIDEKIIKDLFTGVIQLSDLDQEDFEKLKAFLDGNEEEILDLLS